MKKCLLMSLVMAAVFLSGCASQQKIANLYTQGHSAYAKQDYHTAYQKLLTAAQQGDANSQYAVGYMLYNGIGTQRQQADGLLWFQRAAKQGQLHAVEALEQLNRQAKQQAS